MNHNNQQIINNYDPLVSLRQHYPELFDGVVHNNPRSKEHLNWISLPDQLANSDKLTPDQRSNLDSLIHGYWEEKTWVMGGLKCGNDKDLSFPEALLLLNSVEIGHIIGGAAGHIVKSNIKRNGEYPREKSNRRLLDPRAAKSAAHNIISRLDLDKTHRNRRALAVIFTYPEGNGLITVGDNVLESRELINSFYKNCHTTLLDWNAQKLIQAFIFSCEITCRSIRNSTFNPHVHAIIWIKDTHDFSFLHSMRDSGSSINWQENRELITAVHVKRTIRYMLQATSLVQVYRREYSEDNLWDFNRMTRNAHHHMHQLWSGAGGRSMTRKFSTKKISKRIKIIR